MKERIFQKKDAKKSRNAKKSCKKKQVGCIFLSGAYYKQLIGSPVLELTVKKYVVNKKNVYFIIFITAKNNRRIYS